MKIITWFKGLFAKPKPKRKKLRVVKHAPAEPEQLPGEWVNGYRVDKWEDYKGREHEDPFNPGNTIICRLNRTPNTAYGSLLISHVNGVEIPEKQFVYATPKMHYPHDTNGKFRWTKEISTIVGMEKLDGSNILQYQYKDADGNSYISYKTRLQPFMKDDFARKWKLILDKYPLLPTLRSKNEMNLSFELYGWKNLVLIKYPNPLDVVILFGRDDKGEIYPWNHLVCENIPGAEIITVINEFSNLEDEYYKVRNYLNTKLKITTLDAKGKVLKVCDGTNYKQPDDDGNEVVDVVTQDLVEGLEGSIWYAYGDKGYVQYKVKPDYVMDIHTKASIGVPKHSILITIKNCYEDMDTVTVDYVIELLKEEFQEQDIYKKIGFIKRSVTDNNLKQGLKREIVADYIEQNEADDGFDINKDKGKVMRYFAGKFDELGLSKKNSSTVYTILNEEFGDI